MELTWLVRNHMLFILLHCFILAGGSDSKESACNAGDLSSVPGWERSPEDSPEEGNGYPLQYSFLESSWTEEPGEYSPWGCKESDTTE